jgi:hypothetical protein
MMQEVNDSSNDFGGDLDREQSNIRLGDLGIQIAVLTACAARREGSLSAEDEAAIQAVIDAHAARIEREPYRNAKKIIASISDRWSASAQPMNIRASA